MVKHFVEHPLFVHLDKEELVSTELNFMIFTSSVLLRTICLYKSAINEVKISMFTVLAEAGAGLPESSTT